MTVKCSSPVAALRKVARAHCVGNTLPMHYKTLQSRCAGEYPFKDLLALCFLLYCSQREFKTFSPSLQLLGCALGLSLSCQSLRLKYYCCCMLAPA